MRMRTCWIGMLLSLLGPGILMAQESPVFSHITLEDGMPDVTVFDMLKDSEGFIWIGTRNGLARYDGIEFVTYLHDQEDSTSLPENSIRSLFCSRNGSLWIGTRKGLSRYLPDQDHFERISFSSEEEEGPFIHDMAEDKAGRLWLATQYGVYVLEEREEHVEVVYRLLDSVQSNAIHENIEGTFWIGTDEGLFMAEETRQEMVLRQVDFLDVISPGTLLKVEAIELDDSRRLWLGTRNHGLIQCSPADWVYQRKMPARQIVSEIAHPNVRDIVIRPDGQLWVGTYGGISLYDPETEKGTSYSREDFVPTSLNNNAIKCLYLDESEVLWIGTYYGGINIFSQSNNLFRRFEHQISSNSLSYNIVSSFSEDREGDIWIGTEGGGLNHWDRSAQQFTSFQFEEIGTGQQNNIKTVTIDQGGTIWVGAFQKGLYSFDPVEKKFRSHTFPASGNQFQDSLVSVYGLLADQDTLWVGTYGKGVWYIPLTSSSLKPRPATLSNPSSPIPLDIRVILRDRRGHIWIGASDGLYELSRANGFSFSLVIPGTEVFSLAEDDLGRIWVGTFEKGLIQFDPRTNEQILFKAKAGLPHQSVYGIAHDRTGAIWISSPTGIASKAPEDSVFTPYSTGEGLPTSAYNLHAYKKLSSGEILFGSIQGFVLFDPSTVRKFQMRDSFPLVFTGITVLNHPIHVNDGTGILKQSINQTTTLEFDHDNASLTIEFALLNFINTTRHQFSYKLDGIDRNWNEVTGKGSATYTIQNSGTYTFWVKGRPHEGAPFTQRSLTIKVNPPFWGTAWAFLLYFLLVSGILLIVLKVIRDQNRMKRQLFEDQVEMQKQEELAATRQMFFTNVTHEFRTPITLILGYLEELMVGRGEDKALMSRMDIIKSQSQRLLNLVTEMLTLSKQRVGFSKLQLQSGDLVKITSGIFHAFSEQAASRSIHYHFVAPENAMTVPVDLTAYEKILSNLLSNAFKFTKVGGNISIELEAEETYATLTVRDNGKGISEADLPQIFKRFYSTTNMNADGMGIGLSLTKELVERHGWEIHAESTIEVGTEFTLLIPLTESSLPQHESVSEVVTADRGSLTDALVAEQVDIPSVLVVEDNPDISRLLQEILSRDFFVKAAFNGQEGLESVKEKLPDLIISDVMMPEVDGLQMLSMLKADEQTRYVPVLLLSARHELESRLEGLELGADDYISKPFSPEELRLKVKNILDSRQKLRQQFVRVIHLEPKEMILEDQDEVFLSKLTSIVEDHLGNPGFGVNELSLELGVSRPVLFKKIKSLTEQTPKKFINSFRLKRAAQLLTSSDLGVAEVAYNVGFRDPKYFSRLFRDTFGEVPGRYVK